jgi:hypothetical protein
LREANHNLSYVSIAHRAAQRGEPTSHGSMHNLYKAKRLPTEKALRPYIAALAGREQCHRGSPDDQLSRTDSQPINVIPVPTMVVDTRFLHPTLGLHNQEMKTAPAAIRGGGYGPNGGGWRPRLLY